MKRKTVEIYRVSPKKWNFRDFFMNFGPEIFPKNYPYKGNCMWGIDCTHSQTLKMFSWSWFREKNRVFVAKMASKIQFSGSRKRFHASRMCAIDSPHQITPIRVIFRNNFRVQNSLKKSKFFHFFGTSCKLVGQINKQKFSTFHIRLGTQSR